MSILRLALSPGITALLLLSLSIAWMLKNEKDRARPLLVLGLTLNLLYNWSFNILMGKAGSLLHWKYDYYLYRVDKVLGISAAVVALSFRGFWPVILSMIYSVMVPMMIFWVLVNRKQDVGTLVRTYAAELVVGPILYGVMPACGPAYAFGKVWTHPPVVQLERIQLSAIPNAFPSLHLATALVFVLVARSRLWRGVSLAFLAGTALATLTTGEHYVIDLVAGLAFGCFAVSAGSCRIRRAIAYLGITLAWSLAIRFGVNALIAYPGVVRLFSMLTVLVALHAVWVEWRADRSQVPCKQMVRSEEEMSMPAVSSA
jgi:PAP2 superfamily